MAIEKVKELLEAVTCLCEQIRAEKNMDEKKKYYENLVRERIVSDLIQGICNPVNIDAAALSLDSGIYQVVSYEKYAFHTESGVWNPDDLFRVFGNGLFGFRAVGHIHRISKVNQLFLRQGLAEGF